LTNRVDRELSKVRDSLLLAPEQQSVVTASFATPISPAAVQPLMSSSAARRNHSISRSSHSIEEFANHQTVAKSVDRSIGNGRSGLTGVYLLI
jgi:hypothetical protein